jgi:hypothetical protein
MKVGGSPRRNLHARLAELEAENRKLRLAVQDYARAALREFLVSKGPGGESDSYRRLWSVASGRHKGRGIVTPKQAALLRQLYTDAQGWWVNNTFLPNAEWLALAETSIKP